MASVTSNIDTRAGDGTITITHSSLPSTSAETAEISEIEVEFDLEIDEDKAKDVFLNFGNFTFTWFDGLSNGDSLFEELDAITSTDEITVELFMSLNNGRSFTDNFIFNPSDAQYKREERSVEIECRPKISDLGIVADIFTNNPSDVEDMFFYASDPGIEDCMAASDFIGHVLDLVNSGNTNINDTFAFKTDGKSGGDTYVIHNRGAAASVDDVIYYMAVVEGDILSSFMGYNFIVNRLSTEDTVSLSEDVVEKLDIDIGLNSYFSIKLSALSTVSFPGTIGMMSEGHLIGTADGLNDFATKQLDAFFREDHLVPVTWSSGNSRYEGDTGDTVDIKQVYVDGSAKKDDNVIPVDDGSGSSAPLQLSSGDLVFFDDNQLNFTPSPFYRVDGQSATQLTLQETLIDDISDNLRVWSIEDMGRNALAGKGVDCYAHSYGALGANMIKITIFGVDTVKPYQSFSFDSSFPTAIQGTTYRASVMKYILEEDKIEIEAYRIG